MTKQNSNPNDIIYEAAADKVVKELGLKYRHKLSNRKAARIFYTAVCLMVAITNGSTAIGGIFAFLMMISIFGAPITRELTPESQHKFAYWLKSQPVDEGE